MQKRSQKGKRSPQCVARKRANRTPVTRRTVVTKLTRVRERLDQVVIDLAGEARRRALAQGQELDTRPIQAQVKANHFALLSILCEEFGVAPEEIGLEMPHVESPSSIALPPGVSA